jgi:hypothetical protein
MCSFAFMHAAFERLGLDPQLAEVLEEPIADVVERAILAEYARFLRKHPPEREED